MDALELLQRVTDRYMTAVAFHWESADLMQFLSLPGFAALHEYQFLDESQMARKVKKYVIDNHNIVLPDGAPQDVNIIAPLVKGKTRLEYTSADKWNAIQKSWDAYYEWERGSKKEYEEIAKSLMDIGAVRDSIFLKDIVEDVSRELAGLSEILLSMRGMDYDLPTITSMQPEIKKKYHDLTIRYFTE